MLLSTDDTYMGIILKADDPCTSGNDRASWYAMVEMKSVACETHSVTNTGILRDTYIILGSLFTPCPSMQSFPLYKGFGAGWTW